MSTIPQSRSRSSGTTSANSTTAAPFLFRRTTTLTRFIAGLSQEVFRHPRRDRDAQRKRDTVRHVLTRGRPYARLHERARKDGCYPKRCCSSTNAAKTQHPHERERAADDPA